MEQSPKQAIKYFKDNPDYTLVALVQANNKLGYKLKEIPLNTVQDVQKALKLNAHVVSISEYHKAWEVINKNIWSETSMSAWQSLIRFYKIGYLTNPGTWFHNGIDSFIKNMAVTGEGPGTTARYYVRAVKSIYDYEDTIRQLQKVGGGALPPDSEIMRWLEHNSRMSWERFKYLRSFFNDAVAGGEAAVFTRMNRIQQKAYIESLMNSGAITSDTARSLRARRDFHYILNTALYPMNYIERIARLAEYDMLSAKGVNGMQAIQLIEKTHYAYSVKSEFEQTMELLIPFYTFTSRNLHFWLTLVDENPLFYHYLRDVLFPLWNLEQYDPEESEENKGLNSSILTGNILFLMIMF
jgi:hypothetical protein